MKATATTKFQQRHYVTLAAEINKGHRMAIDFHHEALAGRVDPEFARGWNAAIEFMAGRLANEFERDSGKFDRDRFNRACLGL